MVLHHAHNRGKGAALKTGLEEITKHLPEMQGVVTADADGQHSPADILAVAKKMLEHPDSLVLAVRDFSVCGCAVAFQIRKPPDCQHFLPADGDSVQRYPDRVARDSAVVVCRRAPHEWGKI